MHAQYAKAPDAYTVTKVDSMMGPDQTMEISRDGNRVAVETSYPRDGKPNGFHVRAIYDLAAGKNYSVDLNQSPAQCSAGNFSGDWGDPFGGLGELAALHPKDIGTETVNGMAAKVQELTIPGQPGPAKVWIEGKYGLVLKLEMGGKTVMEVKKVSFAKPPASALAMPAACAGVKAAPTEAENIAAATGGNAADFANATMAPQSPSRNSCTVLFRVVRAGSMTPVNGFQVAIDKTVDLDHPASYKMGVGANGHMTFAGGGLKELTSQLQNGVLRIDDLPAYFDVETAFGNAGSSSALIYRQCLGPQTVLLQVIPNSDKLSDGPSYWLWVKSGKYATAPAR
jgi:hypothetical protein